MKRTLAITGTVLLTAAALAVDINPNRRTVPEKFINPPGKRFSLFAGDPERVQRANEVNLADFRAVGSLEPASISLSNPTDSRGDSTTGVKVTLRVQNISKKKRYPLSFPDAQRYDIALLGPGDELLYLWSDDKLFTQESDAIFVNAGEIISYSDLIPNAALQKAGPGTYRVMIVMANYPELKDIKELVVRP
jgi:hypothetical protein